MSEKFDGSRAFWNGRLVFLFQQLIDSQIVTSFHVVGLCGQFLVFVNKWLVMTLTFIRLVHLSFAHKHDPRWRAMDRKGKIC
jgi:hypothetical protein